MALQFRKRLALRVAGIICLVACFFPTIKLNGMVISGDVSTVKITNSQSWRIEFFCWPTAVAAFGVGLLIASFWVRESSGGQRTGE